MTTGPAVLALVLVAANLDLLPPTGITLVALPMKIHGGSGGPLRAMAIVEER